MIEVADKLEKYAELDESEWGETCMALINLSHYSAYISERFAELLLEEMNSNLDAAVSGATIIEEPTTQTFMSRRLEWNE